MLNRRPRHELQEKDAVLSAEVKTVNSQRFELLARKYGGGPFTPEDQMRLDWLASRIQQLVPRMTEGDLENLKEFERRLTEREVRLRELRQKYRMDETG